MFMGSIPCTQFIKGTALLFNKLWNKYRAILEEILIMYKTVNICYFDSVLETTH